MRIRTLDDTMTPVCPGSPDEWETLRKEMLAELRFSSSIDLLKHDTPLNAKVFGTREYDGFVVEKVILQTLPGFYLTGNLYRPKDTSRKHPAVLNPHGHWTLGRVDMNPLGELPVRYANLALRGMVAFAYDMIGYCDNNQLPHANMLFKEAEDWNFGSFTLQLNNSIKAVDFVESLPYVDKDRIACTGCSGGGTQTYFLTALDNRIKAAAPINMVSTVMQGGCTCENHVFLRRRFNNVDYTMLTAPRPLFLSGSDGDWTVHSQEVEFPAVRRIYELYGAKDRFECFYQHAPHCYNKPTRERVYDFLCRNLGLENPSFDEYPVDLDLDDLKIGDIRPYVPSEGFIENDRQLFEVVKGIMKKNLSMLSPDERNDIHRRVWQSDLSEETDIPYTIAEKAKVISLGACPKPCDREGSLYFPDDYSRGDTQSIHSLAYYHCYNTADDTRRVNVLVRLFQSYPDYEIHARGKTAALVSIALKQTGERKVFLTEPDYSDLHIPGSALC